MYFKFQIPQFFIIWNYTTCYAQYLRHYLDLNFQFHFVLCFETPTRFSCGYLVLFIFGFSRFVFFLFYEKMFLGTCGVLFWKTKEHGLRRWDVQVKNAEMDCSDHRQSKTESYKGNDASNGFLSSPCNSSLSNEGSSKSKKESSRTCEAIKNRNSVADEKAKAHHQRSASLGNICKSPQNFKHYKAGQCGCWQ